MEEVKYSADACMGPHKVGETSRWTAQTVQKNYFVALSEIQHGLKEAGTEESKDTFSRSRHQVPLGARSSRITPLLKHRHIICQSEICCSTKIGLLYSRMKFCVPMK